MNTIYKHRRISFWLFSAFIFLSFGFSPINDNNFFFKINKGIDTFGKVYQEIANNYVEKIDPERLMHASIDGMLDELDPYTQFFDESETDEVELITTGKYGGVGITIGIRDGYVTVMSLMEGYSAQRQGIIPGDKIIEIDGKNIVGVKAEEVRRLTRGDPFTEVKVKVDRDGEKEPLDFSLMREEIQLKSVTYSDFIEPGLAYLRLERFTRTTGEDVRFALQELKMRGEITSLILDIRDNPGGLLDAAVEVAETFLPKNTLIVSTKGREGTNLPQRDYRTSRDPLIPNIPLVVLANRNSASASEIVAGAIQDDDRGIILGTRTYGKGLVQTILNLPYNAQLKITSAKYYTPSGRCIQEIEYNEKHGGVFSAAPESLRKEFTTIHNRKVKDLGGITPDTLVEPLEVSSLYKALMQKSFLFKYANAFVSANKEMPLELPSDNAMLSDFKRFVADKQFTFEDESETKLKEISDLATKSKMSSTLITKLDEVKDQLTKEKDSSYERSKHDIVRTLKMEIMSRYRGEKGRIEFSLKDDEQVLAAVGILKSKEAYNRLLSPQIQEAKANEGKKKE